MRTVVRQRRKKIMLKTDELYTLLDYIDKGVVR